MGKLNQFLKQIEENLVDLTVIQRADIIKEIQQAYTENSAILDIPAKDYVNKKRAEHGLDPFKKVKEFSLLAFVFKLFLSFFILCLLGIAFLVWKFTPIIKIDEKNESVTILGGIIQVDGKAGKVKIFDEYHFSEAKYKNQFQGDITLDDQKDEVSINFNSGAFKLKVSDTSQFKFDCKVEKVPKDNVIDQESDIVKFDFTKMSGVNCDFSIPADKKISIDGLDAKIDIDQPLFDAYVTIKNGNVSITPGAEVNYNYDLKVTNGYTGTFESSKANEAYEIKVSVENGAISNH